MSQCENKKLQNAVQEVKVLVEKGDTLAGAMSTMPDVFPSILVNMVEAGELPVAWRQRLNECRKL